MQFALSLTQSSTNVGTTIVPQYVQDSQTPYCSGAFFGKLCDGCRACNASTTLSRRDMLDYKYQISVEGYGPTADAFLWKLKSNSVVMHIVPSSSREPYYTAWFWPYVWSSVNLLNTIPQHASARRALHAHNG